MRPFLHNVPLLYVLWVHSVNGALDSSCSEKPLRVWIDTDTSAGLPGRDIDDALALLHCLRSPRIEVVGVSVVFGNAALTQQLDIAKDIISRFGAPKHGTLPVLEGAGGPENLGAHSAAVAGMLTALRESPMTILAIGPLTNVATLLQRHPKEAARGIVRVVAVAGRRPGQRFTTGSKNPAGHPDLNFEKDTSAFRALLAAPVPVTLCPFELSSQVWLTASDLLRLRDGGGAMGAWVHEVGLPWLELWAEVFGVDGFNPFDSLAALYLDAPELLACDEELPAWIEEGASDGADPRLQGTVTERKLYLHVAREGPPAADSGGEHVRSVKYCHTPLVGTKEELLKGLLAEGRDGNPQCT